MVGTEMDGQIFLGWLKINISVFIAAFFMSLFLAFLFPDTMLWFVRGWGGIQQNRWTNFTGTDIKRRSFCQYLETFYFLLIELGTSQNKSFNA